MYTEVSGFVHDDRCFEQGFRLAVYEAGHALTARALGLQIVSVKMLPRPPVLVSDKTFKGNDWASLVQALEIRIIELFGGQIAEEIACSANTCCSGDVARIDELTCLVSGLGDEGEADDIYFRLEDVAQKIFEGEVFQKAIIPVAEFLHNRVSEGREVIDGADLEEVMDKYVPELPKEKKWVDRMFGFGRK